MVGKSAYFKKCLFKGKGFFSLACTAVLLMCLPCQTFQAYGDGPVSGHKAVIVDHLSLSCPNPAFVKECSTMLETAGFAVDYHPGEKVTVELYRNLPSHGYELIILRAHSAYIPKYLSLAIFTSEPYTKKRYVYEQLRNRVASGFIEPYQEGDPRYLVITDKFVRYSMKGTFDDAVIIMMGCTGIKKCAANAFVQKGARAYIGWTGTVAARDTDLATIQTLRRLLVKKQPIRNAVIETMKDIKSELQYESSLLFWPIKAGDLTLELPEEGNRGSKLAKKE